MTGANDINQRMSGKIFDLDKKYDSISAAPIAIGAAAALGRRAGVFRIRPGRSANVGGTSGEHEQERHAGSVAPS